MEYGRYVITTNNTTLTEGMKNCIKEKFMFLDSFIKKEEYIKINISVKNNTKSIRILFEYLSHDIMLSEEDEDLYVAIDRLKNKVKLKTYKINKKIKEKRKDGLSDVFFREVYSNKDNDIDINSDLEKNIVKRKDFFLKPMSEEEAILQMELLKHSSFMFINTDLNFKMCLLYKRKDGNYGIIESQIRDR